LESRKKKPQPRLRATRGTKLLEDRNTFNVANRPLKVQRKSGFLERKKASMPTISSPHHLAPRDIIETAEGWAVFSDRATLIGLFQKKYEASAALTERAPR
jgi:hypothetical protein